MRLLVTGGAGFIGSHIVELALAKGWEVAVLDDLSSGSRSNLPPHIPLFVGDIRDMAVVKNAFAMFKPDVVNHQAAQVSVSASVRRPSHDAAVNIVGTVNLVEACVKYDVRRFVFASSGGALYGDLMPGDQGEERSLVHPKSPYAVSKYAAELYLGVARSLYGLQTFCLRYANVYGPRQNPHGEAGVIAIFCERALRGQALEVNGAVVLGDEGCTRDYVFVRDVALLNIAVANSELDIPVLNVGTGIPTTTKGLANEVMLTLGRAVPVIFAEPRHGDVLYSVLKPSELVTAGVGSRTTLSEGLLETVAWFRSRLVQE